MWVARNKDGSLWICNTKPIRTSDKGNKGYWEYDDFDGILEIKDKSLFSDLTWEDEPLEVELIQSYSVPDDMEFSIEDARAYSPTLLKKRFNNKEDGTDISEL